MELTTIHPDDTPRILRLRRFPTQPTCARAGGMCMRTVSVIENGGYVGLRQFEKFGRAVGEPVEVVVAAWRNVKNDRKAAGLARHYAAKGWNRRKTK